MKNKNSETLESALLKAFKRQTAQSVRPNGDKWSAGDDNGLTSRLIFDTQAEAIAEARRRAKINESELIICGKDGEIDKKI